MRYWRALLLAVLLAPAPGIALEVNEANRAQLERLNGLGVARVERLLQERARAPFKNWEDLVARVKGIGTKGMQHLGAQGLTVNGQPPPSSKP